MVGSSSFPRQPPRRRLAKAFYGALLEGLRVCSRCSPLPGPCKPELCAPFLAILTNLRVTAGAISAGVDPDRVPEVRGDSGPITPRVTFVSSEGEAFVQSFTNLQDFAPELCRQSYTARPAER